MANNEKLHKAKDAKQDEFYTRREDIENELRHYSEHFENKVVYCNCDDPKESEFWQFFVRNFRPWKLKKLIATHFEPNEKNYAYKLELSVDTNGDGKIDWTDEPIMTALPCNGDFRNATCIELLKEADIVVTNPPFSLFREYVGQLIEYRKQFVIIGHQNAVKYKEIFPLIHNNEIWLGYGFKGNVGFFSSTYKDVAVSSQHKDGYIRVSGVIWLTNMDIQKRHETLDLRGNYYKSSNFKKFDNYNAINIDKVVDIPCDYDGIMGVPITFMDKYNPEQFEIIGRTGNIEWATTECDFFTPPSVEKQKEYRKQNKTWRVQNGYYVTDDGIVHTLYDRFFIRNKHPQERKYKNED